MLLGLHPHPCPTGSVLWGKGPWDVPAEALSLHVCSEMSSLCPALCRPGEVAGRQEKRMFKSFMESFTTLGASSLSGGGGALVGNSDAGEPL